VLRLYLKYYEDKPVIRSLRRVSRPGRRIYKGADEMPRVRNGLGLAIVSTSKGMMTDRQARSHKVGGEVMALVW
jgi:small subunit ribosomal protein S8